MKRKILLVDDSQTALMLERMLLSSEDFEVITAVDGAQAVERAAAEHPDIILMDVVMPKVDGFEACKRIRADERTRGIPIIMVTTRSEAWNVEHAYACGCNDYVTKPIDRLELLSKMRDLLPDRAP